MSKWKPRATEAWRMDHHSEFLEQKLRPPGKGPAWLALVSLSLKEGLVTPGPRPLRRTCWLVLVSVRGIR